MLVLFSHDDPTHKASCCHLLSSLLFSLTLPLFLIPYHLVALLEYAICSPSRSTDYHILSFLASSSHSPELSSGNFGFQDFTRA